MKRRIPCAAVLIVALGLCGIIQAGEQEPRSVEDAVAWLQGKSKEMIRASRRSMYDGSAAFPPQVGCFYDAFWLRDYEYMLEGCIEAFGDKELTDACVTFLNAQRADGACVDCVKYDGTPMYQPGYGTIGDNPVADGSQFMVAVAWRTYRKVQDREFIVRHIDRLVKAMNAVPRNPNNGLVHIKLGDFDRAPYGFTDAVRKQGDVLFCSLLYIEASRQLADLLEVAERPDDAKKWRTEADRLVESVRNVFWDGSIGLFLAATAQCKQPDIWGSAFAVYLDVASTEQANAVAAYFKQHYDEIVLRGQIRHLPAGVYWETCARPKDDYQNGAFWATPTGWFVYTLDSVDPPLADRTVLEMVHEYQQHGVPEWVFGERKGAPEYLANVALPIDGIRKMLARRGTMEAASLRDGWPTHQGVPSRNK